jgi:flagellar FliL protein
MPDTDTESGAEEAHEGPGKKGGSKLKLIIVIVGVMVVLSAGGFAVKAFVFSDKNAETDEAEAEAKKAPEPGMAALSPFIVNLADEGSQRFLKCQLVLETVDTETADGIIGNEILTPKLRDTILLTLSAKTVAEVASAEGKVKLRSELLTRINAILENKGVSAVYFAEFVVQ